MRVCRIVDTFPVKAEIIGDLGPNYYYYSKGCLEHGIEQDIICSRKEGQPKYENIDGINIHRVAPIAKHARRDMLFGKFGKESLKKVLELSPDIVHGHNSFHFYIANHKKKLKQKNIKLLTHFHGLVDNLWFIDFLPFAFDFRYALRDRFLSATYFLEWLNVANSADQIIACDNSTKESVLRYFKSKPIHVVYNGVDLKTFKPTKTNLKAQLDAKYLILNIGRPVPWKGVQYLLKAIKEITPNYDGLKCLSLGAKRDAYDKYYLWLESIRKNNQIDNVSLKSTVSYFDLPEYYSAADCFVAPSFPDPSPKTVYEAQACNCPVVGTNGGGIPEIFSPESGLLFEKRNVKDLADKISFVLDNPAKFRNGRKAVEGKATWTKCVSDMVKVYESMN